MVIHGSYKVIVGGNDVTSRFMPRLLSLDVNRSAGKASDTANIEVANKDGSIIVPKDRAPMQIFLNGDWTFEGFVSEVECSINKNGGRTVSISASSVDQGAKPKEPGLRHKDDASFSDVAQEFGSKVGLSVQVLGSISGINRKYWIQQNESFISWGQRTAREIGATFKVIGNRAFFAARNEGLSASGKPLTTIPATWGVNLISGSVRPTVARPKFNKVKVSYFDIQKGKRVEEEIDTGIADVDAALRVLFNSVDKDQAKTKAEALGKESDREKGSGQVTILGDPRAEPEALCIVAGIANGADGAYRIDTVAHKVTKSGGFTTTLSLRQPNT